MPAWRKNGKGNQSALLNESITALQLQQRVNSQPALMFSRKFSMSCAPPAVMFS